MDFNPTFLRDLEHGSSQLVGHLTITEPIRQTETYECAAWFREHELAPGRYEVHAVRHGRWTGDKHGDFRLRAVVPSKIVNACFVSLFGGVACGPDTAGQRELGKTAEYALTIGAGTHLRACLNPGAKHHYDAGEGRGEVRYERGALYTPLCTTFEWLPELRKDQS